VEQLPLFDIKLIIHGYHLMATLGRLRRIWGGRRMTHAANRLLSGYWGGAEPFTLLPESNEGTIRMS
jgi:hypothetical protein